MTKVLSELLKDLEACVSSYRVINVLDMGVQVVF